MEWCLFGRTEEGRNEGIKWWLVSSDVGEVADEN